MALVTINPRKNSKKFFSEATQFATVKDEKGNEKEISTGLYKGERFPSTNQMPRIPYSLTNRKYLVDIPKDELDKLVVECRLQYEDGHKREGEYITSANIFDRKDPFFNHSQLKLIFTEGNLSLDDELPMNKIILNGLRHHKDFQFADSSPNGLYSKRVKYVVSRREDVDKSDESSRKEEIDAITLYSSLTDKKAKKVAVAMGLVSAKGDDDITLVKKALWNAARNSTRIPGRKTKQAQFIELCKSDESEMQTMILIAQAKAFGLLKKVKDTGWTLFGKPIGNTDAEITAYFTDVANQDDVLRVQRNIESD